MALDFYFEGRRFYNLIKREVYSHLKFLLMSIGAISAVILIIYAISITAMESDGTPLIVPWDGHVPMFIASLIILGILFTSNAYKDLLRTHKRYAYLTLPASNLEKFLSMWLLTTVGFTLVYIIYYYLLSSLLNSMGMLITGREFIFFDVTEMHVVKGIKVYLVVQSVFLLGAASFNSLPLLKTLLVLFLAGISYAILTSLSGAIIFADLFNGDQLKIGPESFSGNLRSFLDGDNIERIFRTLFYYVLAPVCWIITYLKIKEREV